VRACIRRGAAQIGGTCIELESQGSRIVLDVGLPLDADPDPDLLPAVPGLAVPDESLLAVFVSHAHRDHYGLLPFAGARPRVFMGRDAARMLEAASLFWPEPAGIGETEPLEHRVPVTRGPFRVTPYLVDHSAYDGYALLVEADGGRVLYSGDLRAHGRKGKLFEQLLRERIDDLDVLLLEGTTLGRPEYETYPTETDIEMQMAATCKENSGLVLVWASAMNIDRLVTIFRATRRSGRTLILDMYAAAVLRATGNPHLPQAEWPQVRVYLPRSQKRGIVRAEAFELSQSFAAQRIYPERLAAFAAGSVMLFRPGMMQELEEAQCLEGAQLIYSMWTGYLDEDRQKSFRDWLRRLSIPMTVCHTSGHASPKDLRRLAQALKPRTVVPVHSEVPERYLELYDNVTLSADGEWWPVGAGPLNAAHPAGHSPE